MKTLDQMVEETIGKEGAYSNHPSDTGGETKWGITIAVARANGYFGSMKELPRETAKKIYLAEYIIKPGFDKIAKVSDALAAELFDTGVNMGQSWGGIFLQRALNAFNKQGTLWPDLKVDGAVGPGTRNALDKFVQVRGKNEIVTLLKAVNCLQGARYIELSEGRQKNEDFTFGWIKNRIEI